MSPRLPWLEQLTTGTQVEVSSVMGNGFLIAERLSENDDELSPTQTIILVAAGSGVAPLKACIESCLLTTAIDPSYTCYRLYYGEWSADDLCFTHLYADWEKMGFGVTPVLSRSNNSQYRTDGHVQEALEEDGVPRNTGAILCGMEGMIDDVTNILVDAGVSKDRILFNF